MATNSREARRRRIVDRGADRLALITGRIQTLPPASASPDTHHSPTAPPTIAHDPPPSTQSLSHQPIVSHFEDDKSSSFEFPHHDSTVESGKINASYDESRAQSISHKSETSPEASRASHWEEDVQVQSFPVPPTVQEDSTVFPSDKDHGLMPQVHRGKFFTPKQVNSAIAATETMRLYCSLIAAIVVVLSFIGFPILGNTIIKSIIYFRPLYLVLVTCISIVLKRLLLEGFERTKRESDNASLIGGYGSTEAFSRALELGFCFKNVTSAIFMDFSVYAIVLICGLCVAQKLGW